MTNQLLTIEQTAAMYGVTVERVKEQYLANAKSLHIMYSRSLRTGKKVNGYTWQQLQSMAQEMYNKAR